MVRIVLAGAGAKRLSAFCEDLVALCEERFGKRLHATSMGRLLRSLGLSRQKARPSHPQKTRPHKRPLKRARRR